MDWLLAVDWKSMFVPEVSVSELVLRGVLMYLTVFVLPRLVLRRQVGGIGTSDILVIACF